MSGRAWVRRSERRAIARTRAHTSRLVAPETSHEPIAPLKLAQLGLQPVCCFAQNRYDKSLTLDTSQRSICPYAAAPAVGFAHHMSRAVRSSARLVKLCLYCSPMPVLTESKVARVPLQPMNNVQSGRRLARRAMARASTQEVDDLQSLQPVPAVKMLRMTSAQLLATRAYCIHVESASSPFCFITAEGAV